MDQHGASEVSKTFRLSPLKCCKHPDQTIELQGLFFKSTRLRRYFRCNEREKGKSWCGYDVMQETGPTMKPEFDVRPQASLKNVNVQDNSKEELKSGQVLDGAVNNESCQQACNDTESSCNQELSCTFDFASLASGHRISKGDDESISFDSVPFERTSKSSFKTVKLKCDKEVSKAQANFTNYRESCSTEMTAANDDCDDKKFATACLGNKLTEDKKGVLSFLLSDEDDDTCEQEWSGLVDSIKTLTIDRVGEKNTYSNSMPKGKSATTSYSEPESNSACEGDESASPKDFDQRDVMLLKMEHAQHVCDLKQLKASIRTAKLELLPDKGQRILGKIKALEKKISFISEKISCTPKQTEVRTGMANGDSKRNNLMFKPLMPGQAIPMPPHQPQNLCPAYQQTTLYGGRMTSSRLFEVQSITSEAIAKLHRQLESRPDEQCQLPDPDGLQVTLMPHQRHALAWLAWREQQHPPSGILADDMGLGKTLTMISHVLKQKQLRQESLDIDQETEGERNIEKVKKTLKRSRPTLIIAPASLIHQWAKEIDRRCESGCLKYVVYHGPNREMAVSKLIQHDIVITTYAIVSREVGIQKEGKDVQSTEDKESETETSLPSEKKEKDLPLLLSITWERIILDEAHEIKNPKSIKSQSVCLLKATHRWSLTGTPIQNDLKDIYALLRFLQFSPFDELKVWKKHIELAHGSTKRINTVVKAFMLRRSKTDCNANGQPMVRLPSRKLQTVLVDLCPEERTVYDKLFQQTRSTVRDYVQRHKDSPDIKATSTAHEPPEPTCANGRLAHINPSSNIQLSTTAARGTSGSSLLVLILRLRQCCCHLSLMKSCLESESLEADGIELSLEEQMKSLTLDSLVDTTSNKSTPDFNSMLSKSVLFERSSLSTKMKCVMDKIKDIQTNFGDKCVIVSQWTKMLEIAGLHLEEANISFSLIQGSVPAKTRADIVDEFNKSSGCIQIILVSLQAGGVGLNLIGGNHLFLLDCHWNPALEEQACDRIYRLGQEKDVFIYRFLCKDTIEEKISSLQERKRRLANSVLTGTGSSNRKLTLDDLRLLFGV